MIGKNSGIRTGIDLGATSVKLVRGSGRDRLSQVTHLGIEAVDGGGHDARVAGAALRRLIDRLGLKRSQLGRVAVAAGGPEVMCREVVIGAMSDETLARALPFEARKHLELESMNQPVLDYQVLGPVLDGHGGHGQIRVLFAATPRAVRDFPVEALRAAGLEPDVVDLEPLAALNALAGSGVTGGTGSRAVGLLGLGGIRSALHLWSPEGGLLSREVGPTVAGGAPGAWAEALTEAVRETVIFFRGRFRRDVAHIHLAGDVAGRADLARDLASGLELPVTLFDPLLGLAVAPDAARAAAAGSEPFTIACGLCRWWDSNH